MTRYTELQISSDLLDQPKFCGEPKKIFILSTPRSGSYLLCRHMINAGLGVPHEYFNPIIIRQIAPRLGLGEAVRDLEWPMRGRGDLLLLRRGERAAELEFLTNYLRRLIPRRCQGGVFAAKIHHRDFVRVLDNPVGRQILDGGVFVHLYREDLLKQAVSEYFSQLTGRWGFDDAVTTRAPQNPDFFDYEAINRTLKDLAQQDQAWRVFRARTGAAALLISYEKLCEDPFSFVLAIARRIGVDPQALRSGYSEPACPYETDSKLPSKKEVAAAYLAHVAAAEGASRWPGAAEFARILMRS